MKKMRIAIDLSAETLKEVDHIFGKRKRSYFIQQVLEEKLGLPHTRKPLLPLWLNDTKI